MKIKEADDIIYIFYEPEENPIEILNMEMFRQLESGKRQRLILLPQSMSSLARLALRTLK